MKLNIQKFASGESQWFEDLPLQMKLTWESTPGDSTQNYSLVTAKIWGARNSSSTKGKSWNGYVNIGGNSHYFSEIYTGQSTTIGTAWVLINYFTDTISHNNDGTKTITISGGLGGPSGTSLSSKYAEGSTTAVLDTIPRGSTFNTTAWNRDTQRLLTSTLSIPATQHVANVYHKLEARFMSSGTETTICTRTGVTIDNGYISFSFTNNELNTIYNLMPKETTHYIRMYLYTYTDSSYQNQLGDVSIIWWTGLIPTSVIPSVTFASYTEGGDVPSSWGVWVKNKSKVNVALSGTGIYGSNISSYSLNGDGVTYYTNPTLTNYLSSSGNITFTGTTTDSRNRQGSATLTLSVEDYYNPTIATAQIQRCDVNGNIDRNGEYVYISYDGSISPCANKNTPYAEYKIGYKTTTNDTYTYITLATNTNNYSATGMLFTDGIFTPDSVGTKLQLSSDYTYDIQFYVKDYFTINDDNVQILDTGLDLLNFNASGKSMAIGKVSEASASDELLEVALDTNFDKDVSIAGNLKINNTTLLDLIYPVGSIYMSVNNVSPQSFLGGTWVALQDRFLLGAGNSYAVNTTGGEATHTLTIAEMPSHNHELKEDFFSYEYNKGYFGQVYKSNNPNERDITNDTIIQNTGGGQAHNNMPPYLAVYMWKRTN